MYKTATLANSPLREICRQVPVLSRTFSHFSLQLPTGQTGSLEQSSQCFHFKIFSLQFMFSENKIDQYLFYAIPFKFLTVTQVHHQCLLEM